MLAFMVTFLWATSITVGEIVGFEVEDDITPGAEKFPLIAAVAVVGYLWIGQLLFS
jgi:hypothetical protein